MAHIHNLVCRFLQANSYRPGSAVGAADGKNDESACVKDNFVLPFRICLNWKSELKQILIQKVFKLLAPIFGGVKESFDTFCLYQQ
jgi:hypothetical protein